MIVIRVMWTKAEERDRAISIANEIARIFGARKRSRIFRNRKNRGGRIYIVVS